MDRRALMLRAARAAVGATVVPVALACSAWPRAVSASASSGRRSARLIRVGPSGDVASIAEAAARARPQDTVLIAPGEYRGDVAVWATSDLTIRADGGPVVLHAGGRAAEGKAIWVVRASDVVVEGIEFRGARVPSRNGAGIRFEQGGLTLRRCRFIDNEMGLLTSNAPDARLVVEQCAFIGNGRDDGHNHNLYVGLIAHLSVSGSYFARGRAGHLLKSRARESLVVYNRLTDEARGRASYELEFPNGGRVLAMANLIAQSPHTENSAIVAYGAEGYRWPEQSLYLVHNTIANRGSGAAVFVKVWGDSARGLVANNVLVGDGNVQLPGGMRAADNLRPWPLEFVDPQAFDYRLRSFARGLREAPPLGQEGGFDLVPGAEYLHPVTLRQLTPGESLVAGALQTSP